MPSRKTQTLVVPLPQVFTVGSLYEIIGRLFNGLSKIPPKVVIDFRDLRKTQVGGITVLSNMIEFCRKLRIRTEIINAESCAALPFLNNSGFAALYLDGTAPKMDTRSEFLPLKLVGYNRSFPYVHYELMPWIAEVFGVPPKSLSAFRVCFEEVFNNIKDHSTIDIGCSCAHFDDAKGVITICISDFGIGIPRKVRRAVKTTGLDCDVIEMACAEGFTTKSTPGNMGAGLHVLIKNVTRNFGSVIIYSGKGIFSCIPDNSGGLEKRVGSQASFNGLYPGTMIYVTLDTKKFVPSDLDQEEFIWE